jgi:hypothetical protein
MYLLDWARENQTFLSIIMIICLLININAFSRHRKSGRMAKGESGYFWRLYRSGDRDGILVAICSCLILFIAIFKLFWG